MAAKFVSIPIAFLMLFNSVHFSVSDVWRIEKLWEHLQFHHEEYGDDLLTFAAKHYGSLKARHSSEQGEEHRGHEHLPFKHLPQNQLSFVFVFRQAADPLLEPDNGDLQKIDSHHYQLSYSFLGLDDIFQPPKQL